jgi:hypothetical protein
MPLRRTAKSAGKKTQVYFDFTVYTTSVIPVNNIPQLIPYVPPVIIQPDGTVVTHRPICGTDCTTCFYSRLQEIILTIIQYITDRVSLDSILTQLEELQEEITTQEQASRVLRRIEQLILSIIDNITNRTNLVVILQRIQYLQTQIVIAGDTSSMYTEINDIIITIIDQIGSRGSLDDVLATIRSLQDTLIPDNAVAEQITEIEEMILSIVDNITYRTNLTVVLQRFNLLQQKVSDLLAVTATGA